MNADSAVMEYFPDLLTRAESDALFEALKEGLVERGWGLWAAEIRSTGAFAGFVGLNLATFDAPFTPAMEIGWRLVPEHWDQGLATEAARCVLAYGFEQLGLDEIVSFTSVTNLRSRRVMEKLDMIYDTEGDFDHPRVPIGHPLCRHVLYRRGR